MSKDLGEEKLRDLTIQKVLTDDELLNYPSYGWPIKCPFCGIADNKSRLYDCDGDDGPCYLCGSRLQISRYENIVSVSTRNVAAQRHIQLCNQGVECGVQGRFEEASKLFKQALDTGKYDRISIENLKIADDAIQGKITPAAAILMFQAIVCLDQGDNSQYIAKLSAALEEAPRYTRSHVDVGVFYAAQGQTDQAIAKFKEALDYNSNSALAHYCLGVAYQKQGQVDDAIREYQASIEAEDNYAESHNNLAFCYFGKGDHPLAKQHLYRAVEHGYIVGIGAVKAAVSSERNATGGCLGGLLLLTLLLCFFLVVK